MEQSTDPKFIIVIGASAGGISALGGLIAQLTNTIDAAICIVLHLSKQGIGEFLSHRLQQFTSLICEQPSEGTVIKKGHVYIAPPNHHLILKKGFLKVTDGPEENRWKPSIDVLFRSAAVTYSERVIGIILTGMLDDGAAGMTAIKECGGYTIIQDPAEAEYPGMPLSVLNRIEVNYTLPLSQMGYVVHNVVSNAVLKGTTVPQELIKEAAISENVFTTADNIDAIGKRSVYGCPDCGGVLWEIKEGDYDRYRCKIGHTYSTADLLQKQTKDIETTLWIAIRIMEDRRNLLKKLADSEKNKGLIRMAEEYQEKADNLQTHINKLKELIFIEESN